MMSSKFAIRDDDTCFFTQPEDLDQVYGMYWGIVPVSLAVVPFSVPEHRGRSMSPSYPTNQPAPLGGNKRLVSFLRDKARRGHVEIMLHGHTHEYKQAGTEWIGEFGWKPQAQLTAETLHGKKYLEQLLETDVRVFVPPSNRIGCAGIRAIRQAGLNLSGIMGRFGDRPWTLDYLPAYTRRWAWRLRHGSPYPYPLSYGGHTELAAHTLTPRATKQQLLEELNHCASRSAPFVLATHYWEFKDDPTMHTTLAALIEAASRCAMTFASVSQCINHSA